MGMLNRHVVHFKLTLLYFNYISVKLGGKVPLEDGAMQLAYARSLCLALVGLEAGRALSQLG